jgi:predicted Zn-dependent protease
MTRTSCAIVSLLMSLSACLVFQVGAQDVQLLVLSEIEEQIAGRLAFVTVERSLIEQGSRVTSDAAISAIGRAVAAYSDRPHLHYTFYVIEGEKRPRAFSLPGGHVFVSRSLLDQVCQTEADIAFILGHEIAHSALRHYADYRLQDMQQVASVRELFQQSQLVDAEMEPIAVETVEHILIPQMIKIRQLKEMEADQFGMVYALRAGYQFSGGFWVLSRLQQLYGDAFELEQQDDLFSPQLPRESSSHPSISKRIEQLELFRIKAFEVAKLFPSARDALDRGDYREASLLFETILSLFPQSRTAHIGLGVAYHLQYWDSSPGDDFLLAYPGALEVEYMYLLQRGAQDMDALQRAISEYQTVLAVEPGNAYARNNLGVALAELNCQTEAAAMLRESLHLSERDFTMFNLGLLLSRQYRSSGRDTLRQEAMRFIKAYIKQIPHDHVAVRYLKELQRSDP